MVVFLDESDDLTRRHGGGSHRNHHVRGIDGHDLNLILGKSSLKSFEFLCPARPFGDSHQSVQFLSLSFLDGTALFKIVIIWVSGISVRVRQSFHRDDGLRTIQVVFVVNGDAGLFDDAWNGSIRESVSFAVSTARPRGVYEGGHHAKSVVGGKFFVGVQFVCQGLEIGVQSFTAFLEFAYGEGGGLEGVREALDCIVKCTVE